MLNVGAARTNRKKEVACAGNIATQVIISGVNSTFITTRRTSRMKVDKSAFKY